MNTIHGTEDQIKSLHAAMVAAMSAIPVVYKDSSGGGEREGDRAYTVASFEGILKSVRPVLLGAGLTLGFSSEQVIDLPSLELPMGLKAIYRIRVSEALTVRHADGGSQVFTAFGESMGDQPETLLGKAQTSAWKRLLKAAFAIVTTDDQEAARPMPNVTVAVERPVEVGGEVRAQPERSYEDQQRERLVQVRAGLEKLALPPADQNAFCVQHGEKCYPGQMTLAQLTKLLSVIEERLAADQHTPTAA